MTFTERLLCALAAFCAITSSGICAETSYPNRPIRLVVSSAAGGTGDTMARAVSRQVERELSTTIVIDNRPGATGVIAVDTVAKSEPNGYTLAHTSSSVVTNASLGRKLPYDPLKDLAPVANLAMAESYLLLVNASLPVNSVKELIAFASSSRSSPGARASRTNNRCQHPDSCVSCFARAAGSDYIAEKTTGPVDGGDTCTSCALLVLRSSSASASSVRTRYWRSREN